MPLGSATWPTAERAWRPNSGPPGISHASFQQKNYRLVHHILHSWFTQPQPVYRRQQGAAM